MSTLFCTPDSIGSRRKCEILPTDYYSSDSKNLGQVMSGWFRFVPTILDPAPKPLSTVEDPYALSW